MEARLGSGSAYSELPGAGIICLRDAYTENLGPARRRVRAHSPVHKIPACAAITQYALIGIAGKVKVAPAHITVPDIGVEMQLSRAVEI